MARRTLDIDDVLHQYVLDHTAIEHPAQTKLREATANHRHAGMQISPEQAQFMQLLVKLIWARRAIEVGVFTGYSALSVALALPADGLLLACDVSDEYTRVGRPFWRDAGVADRIELVLGPARDTLQQRITRGEQGSFDFAFIDADKTGYDTYFEQCLTLLRDGGVIAIDNVLWSGAVARVSTDDDTRALQALNDKLRNDRRVDIAMLPIGDGLTLARKRSLAEVL